jgi:hypothetical protein
MSKSFDVELLVLTGAWDEYAVGPENLVIIQARTAVDIRVRFRGRRPANFFTVKSGDQLPLAYRNGEGQTIRIMGAAGVVVEILTQFKN